MLGLDVGGTKVLGVSLDDAGAVVRELKWPTPVAAGDLVDALVSAACELAPQPSAVGIGIAGLVGRDGRIRVSPHVSQAEHLDLPGELRAALGVPIVVENDANVAAWGEARAGAGRGEDDVVLVTLGTGIGTGLVVDGRLVRGAHGFAGEGGHVIVDRDGPLHVTGLPGAWEHYASGTALGELARARGLAPSGEGLASLVGAGDAAALDTLDAYAREVAIGVADLVAVLDPAVVILAGGVSEIGEPLRARVESHLPSLLIGAKFRSRLRIVLAELGERAGAIGAALLAADASRPTN
ncbi:MAG TPA: ROK family protein [Acidimicrobiales bacterium]|jgi:glucokinase|nr:ROK family protein [Acidimicrobiales bacterium]